MPWVQGDNKRMFKIAIGMGTNLGNLEENLRKCASKLLSLPECHSWQFSRMYQTQAVDCPEPLDFLNAVALSRTDLSPQRLLSQLLHIEEELGRVRTYPHAPRTIDLDLLIYNSKCIQSDHLVLPHPRMHERLFVMEPLVELWPEGVHPVLGKTFAQLCAGLRQSSDPWVVPLEADWVSDLF